MGKNEKIPVRWGDEYGIDKNYGRKFYYVWEYYYSVYKWIELAVLNEELAGAYGLTC